RRLSRAQRSTYEAKWCAAEPGPFLTLSYVRSRISGASLVLHRIRDDASRHFFFSLLCGLRLPMRPDSLPAAGSITALIRVGLPESIAALTARLSSSGDVALTPTPPKASIILS